jgi:hypothetical protein
MKILNIIFGILFILFALVQYNDPDPFLWIFIYSLAAALSFIPVSHRYFRLVFFPAAIFFLALAVDLFIGPDGVWSWLTVHHAENIATTMQASKPWIEETREFFGLLIILAYISFKYFSSSKKSREVFSGSRPALDSVNTVPPSANN